MKLSVVLISFTMIFGISRAVDYSTFKTCNQSSFCRRCRRVVPNKSRFALLPETLSLSSDVVSLDLAENQKKHKFVLKLEVVQGDIFHLEIDEKKPLRPRYRVKDVLDRGLKRAKINGLQITRTTIIITSGVNTAVLNICTLQIDFYKNNVLMVSANSAEMMHFEELRKKSPNDPPGWWDETFNTYNDSKPHGPEAVALDFAFPQAEVLFGIPQHADSFILKSTKSGDPYRLYNLDVPNYVVDSQMALYGSIPVLYAHGPKKTAGIFWNNAAETWIDIYNVTVEVPKRRAPAAYFMSESGIIDVFVLLGPSPLDTFKQYTKLTGRGNLPQLYTLAYHQCRWNYDNETDVDNVSKNFDKYNIPMDTMWLDIEYTNGKRYFTWDKKKFGHPLDMIRNLTERGRHLVVIIDPHIKIDPNYFLHKDCKKLGYYTKNLNGEDYEGSCWPGLSSYPDLTRAEVRKYFADQYIRFNGTTPDVMIWNDMNEPSVFEGPEQTMPKDNLHDGAWEHRDIHNLYGFYHHMSTFDGLSRRDPSSRPFILSRAHFAGSQRYTAVWMGDTTASWKYLQVSVKMCLSEAVAGMSFCGSDVGGFFGDPNPELFARWYQAGAFQPFFRSHAHDRTKRREPWLYPELYTKIIQAAIRKRYSYLPFWYTMFYEHERFGDPVMRPLLAHYPTDRNSYYIDSEYLLQDKLLVSPVMKPRYYTFYVYFPTKSDESGDTWYDIDKYAVYDKPGNIAVQADSFKIPVFQKGGVIVPKKETIRRSSAFMKNDNYTLIVCLDKTQKASGTLFVDDEKSYHYRKGSYLYISYEFSKHVLKNRFIDPKARFTSESNVERIVVAGLSFNPESATLIVGSNRLPLQISQEGKALVIENVGVNVAQLFSINFHY